MRPAGFAAIVSAVAFLSEHGLMHPPEPVSELRRRVAAVLDRDVRPGLQADGGDVELVSIDDDRIVQIRLLGSCSGCSSAVYPMTMGIEAAVKAEVPEIRFLEAVL